jgi:hypothetical protein
MKYDRTFSEGEAGERPEAARMTFNVVIVYDSRIAGNRAMNVFNGLVREFSGEFDFHCDLCRFDVFALPEAREAATRAGAAADLLIVAAGCDIDLPLSVKGWLDESVAEKAPRSAALVTLLESGSRLNDVQSRTRQCLQSAADRSLMDFFLHEVDLPLASAAENLQRRANTVHPSSTKTFTGASHGAARRHGSEPKCKRALSNSSRREQRP